MLREYFRLGHLRSATTSSPRLNTAVGPRQLPYVPKGRQGNIPLHPLPGSINLEHGPSSQRTLIIVPTRCPACTTSRLHRAGVLAFRLSVTLRVRRDHRQEYAPLPVHHAPELVYQPSTTWSPSWPSRQKPGRAWSASRQRRMGGVLVQARTPGQLL